MAVEHNGGGPGGGRRLEELVAVEALAAQRDEEIAFLDAAAIGRHAGEKRVAPAGAPAQRRGGLGEAHHPVLRASAARACSSSEKCSRRPAISW